MSDISRLTLQAYYDRIVLDASILGERRHTGEFNAQHQYQATNQLQLISSLQYRYTEDHITNSNVLGLDPQEERDSLVSFGFQGRFAAIKDVLDLRTGVKFEHNDYSNFEVQPDVGISWTVDPKNTLWASIARAVRIPSRLESDAFAATPAGQVIARGNRDLDSEELLAYQAGYRTILHENLLLDTTAFYNVYDHLVVSEGTSIENNLHGDTWGAELAATIKLQEAWELRAAYTYLRMRR